MVSLLPSSEKRDNRKYLSRGCETLTRMCKVDSPQESLPGSKKGKPEVRLCRKHILWRGHCKLTPKGLLALHWGWLTQMEIGLEDIVIGAISLVKTPKNGENVRVNIWLKKLDSRGPRPTQRNMGPGVPGHRGPGYLRGNPSQGTYSPQRYESRAGQLPIAVARRLGSNSQGRRVYIEPGFGVFSLWLILSPLNSEYVIKRSISYWAGRRDSTPFPN